MKRITSRTLIPAVALICLAAATLVMLPVLATNGDYGVNADGAATRVPTRKPTNLPAPATSVPLPTAAQPTQPPPTATPVPPTTAPTATQQQRPTATNCPSGMIWDPREEQCVPIDLPDRGD